MRWFSMWPSEAVHRNSVQYAEEASRITTQWVDGYAYGQALVNAWRRAHEPRGLFVLEWDVAVDPLDMAAMELHARMYPDQPATGVVRLWHDTTGLDDPVWSHRHVHPSGWPHMRWGTEYDREADTMSLACCYLPAGLFREHAARIADFRYPSCDTMISRIFYDAKVPIAVVQGCRPKHVHWTRP